MCFLLLSVHTLLDITKFREENRATQITESKIILQENISAYLRLQCLSKCNIYIFFYGIPDFDLYSVHFPRVKF